MQTSSTIQKWSNNAVSANEKLFEGLIKEQKQNDANLTKAVEECPTLYTLPATELKDFLSQPAEEAITTNYKGFMNELFDFDKVSIFNKKITALHSGLGETLYCPIDASSEGAELTLPQWINKIQDVSR